MSGTPEDGTDHYEPDHSHDGGRPRGRCRTLKDRTLSAPDSAIARVMAEIENALRLLPNGRRPQQSGAALSGLSVLGRFNSLIVDFISLFVRFISLFGRVGNLHSGVLQYQYLAGTGRVAGPPRIGLFAVFSCRPGNPIPAGYPATSPFSRDRRSSASRGLSSSGRVSRSNASARRRTAPSWCKSAARSRSSRSRRRGARHADRRRPPRR